MGVSQQKQNVVQSQMMEAEKDARGENSQIRTVRIMQNQKMRDYLKEYKIEGIEDLEDLDSSDPLALNIILFGPSGSGKSSLIKTFYMGANQKNELPSDITNDLIIQKLHHNEGTQRLTRIPVKRSTQSIIETGKNIYRTTTSGINCLDTRGQIYLSQHEMQQFNVIIEGKVKDMSLVEQRNFRYAYYLWEFWKKSSDLFDEDILREQTSLESTSHSVIIVFDGSLDEIPNGEEETQFYRQIIASLQSRGYHNPQIVMSRLDLVEKRMKNMFSKHENLTDTEKQMRLSEVIDLKIQQVVTKLSVPRSSVHFIENYNTSNPYLDENVNYYTLKLLQECLKQGQSFISHYIEQKRRNSSIFDKIKDAAPCSIF